MTGVTQQIRRTTRTDPAHNQIREGWLQQIRCTRTSTNKEAKMSEAPMEAPHKDAGLVHQESGIALMTRRPEMVVMLRKRLMQQGLDVFTEDVAMLLNALETSVRELAESDHRLNEADRVLRDLARTLDGTGDQVTRVRNVIRNGGSYQNAVERERE